MYPKKNKRILMLVNHEIVIYNFRKEIIESFLDKDYEVYISSPNGKRIEELKNMGCHHIETNIDRRGTNPFKDLMCFLKYLKIIKQIKPDVVLTYTIKPNIYGGLACRLLHTPYLSNVTGLGTSLKNNNFMQKVILCLYKVIFKRANSVFFQNSENKAFFIDRNLVQESKTNLLPGSGVNIEEFAYEEYPDDEVIKFLFLGRIMKEKGIDELFEAAKIIKQRYHNIQFDIIGPIEEEYEKKLQQYQDKGIIKYYGMQYDVKPFIKKSSAVILPSYHEGLANSLLEAAAIGRPVLASKISGCVETFDENTSGMGFEVKNTKDMFETIVKFIELPIERKRDMGIAGRVKMEKDFNRKIVIQTYIDEINNIFEGNKNELI